MRCAVARARACSTWRSAHPAPGRAAVLRQRAPARPVGRGVLRRREQLMSQQHRSRPPPVPPDRPRQDQAEPAQVHLPRRDDRRKGKDVVSIPLPQIDIPHFRFGDKQQGGVGQGDGESGDSLGQGEAQPGAGRGGRPAGRARARGRGLARRAGRDPRRGARAARIEPKGKEKIVASRTATPASGATGPESLRHFRRTFKQALQAPDREGTYNPKRPGDRADPRRHALPLVEDRAGAAVATRSSST